MGHSICPSNYFSSYDAFYTNIMTRVKEGSSSYKRAQESDPSFVYTAQKQWCR